MATLELYRRSTIGMFLTEILDEMVSNCTISPELAIQVLVQFDKVLLNTSLAGSVLLLTMMIVGKFSQLQIYGGLPPEGCYLSIL
ncbi:hypothetical protein V6N13_012031 [Hibiscus sabdariffa]|uniref:Transcription initiation factor IIA gamma subunit N-terminal domain-containing protein n=1 Tax=Hibiscus sabdariffa TaxID=183260 RepID=A0ABR2SE48_9ROSI